MPTSSSLSNNSNSLPPGLISALKYLRRAYDCAQETRQSAWDFAVEMEHLLSSGLSYADSRWLIAKAYVEHAVETTRPNGKQRYFRQVGSTALPTRTCLVLTPSGVDFCDRMAGSLTVDELRRIPEWDARLLELRLGEHIVKRLNRHPAPTQELILAVFEEEGWPEAIDDPLPTNHGVDTKRRLHHTVRNLNRAQHPHSIHFSVCDHGKSICWKLAAMATQNDAYATRMRRQIDGSAHVMS